MNQHCWYTFDIRLIYIWYTFNKYCQSSRRLVHCQDSAEGSHNIPLAEWFMRAHLENPFLWGNLIWSIFWNVCGSVWLWFLSHWTDLHANSLGHYPAHDVRLPLLTEGNTRAIFSSPVWIEVDYILLWILHPLHKYCNNLLMGHKIPTTCDIVINGMW